MKPSRKNRRYRLLLLWGLGSGVLAGLLVWTLFKFSAAPQEILLAKDGKVDGLTNIHQRSLAADPAQIQFEENAAQAGIRFHHFPARRDSLLVEDMGSGAAWGDYDNDGDPDLFLVNFAGRFREPLPENNPESWSRLFQNQGDGTFVDVTCDAGLNRSSFGMGASWGDYDNDDDLDLYVTNYGSNFLYRNNGNGTFTEAGREVGVDDSGFGSGCAWGDYNRDGNIDLYVCNYVDFVLREGDHSRQTRQYNSEIPYTLNPSSYAAQKNCLYRNNGDGTFTNVADEVGVSDPEGRSLCVVWVDFDNDHWPDIYVANDVSKNSLYRNRGDGTFEDLSLASLAADYRGAMGIAVADYDHDSDQDMFITHWLAQENGFFENMFSFMKDVEGTESPVMFIDRSDELGLGQISLDTVGWSTSFADLDNDGHEDLWVANGNTLEVPDQPEQLAPQKMFLFRQIPPKGFFEVGEQAGSAFTQPVVARGGAQADYNGDGRLDMVVQVHGGSPLLLTNKTKNAGHWLALRLRQSGKNTSALGARVVIRYEEDRQTAQVGSQGSYLSQNDFNLHFGLGNQNQVDELDIYWPDGCKESFYKIQADLVVEYTHTPHYPQKNEPRNDSVSGLGQS